jgi:hypothetical protein
MIVFEPRRGKRAFDVCCAIKLLGVSFFAIPLVARDDAVVKFVSAAVLTNGFVCHTLNTPAVIVWDVVWNVAFVAFVNSATSWQPQTVWLTLVSFCGFGSSCSSPSSVSCSLIHVVFVQWPLLVALLHFQMNL